MQIPLVDLKAQYIPLREEIMRGMAAVLDSMHLTTGPNLADFEENFAAFCGAAYCVGVANGTDALQLALRACDVGLDPADEVITVSHSFIATTEGIWQAGARPVFVDIDPRTYTMDVSQVEAKITAHTRAILPVHIHGQMADMVSLREIADRYNLYLIEDAAQAHGASLNGKPAGSWGDLACFSFYPGKNLGAYGEAGAITTDNQALAERLRVLRNHGSETKYKHIELGFNSRLDELQAVVLRAKLPYINRWNEGRRKIARQYDRLLTGSGLVTPFVAPGSVSAYHHYAVTSGSRDALLDWLQANGIGAGIHYPLPIHLQPAGMRYGYAPGSLPVTEKYTASTLSLPIYAEMTDEQVNYIVAKVFEFKELKEKPRIKDSLVTMK